MASTTSTPTPTPTSFALPTTSSGGPTPFSLSIPNSAAVAVVLFISGIAVGGLLFLVIGQVASVTKRAWGRRRSADIPRELILPYTLAERDAKRMPVAAHLRNPGDIEKADWKVPRRHSFSRTASTRGPLLPTQHGMSNMQSRYSISVYQPPSTTIRSSHIKNRPSQHEIRRPRSIMEKACAFSQREASEAESDPERDGLRLTAGPARAIHLKLGAPPKATKPMHSHYHQDDHARMASHIRGIETNLPKIATAINTRSVSFEETSSSSRDDDPKLSPLMSVRTLFRAPTSNTVSSSLSSSSSISRGGNERPEKGSVVALGGGATAVAQGRKSFAAGERAFKFVESSKENGTPAEDGPPPLRSAFT